MASALGKKIAFLHPINPDKNGNMAAPNIPPVGKAALKIPKAVPLDFRENHSLILLLAEGTLILTAKPVKVDITSIRVKFGAMECRAKNIPVNSIPNPNPHLAPLRSTKRPANIAKIAEEKKKNVECKPS